MLAGLMAPVYSDEPWQVASALVLTVAGFALLVIPSLFMMLFVRTRVLFLFGVLALSASAVSAMVATARSDDAQAGLALLWAPYLGGIAAIVLALLDVIYRRRGQRSHA